MTTTPGSLDERVTIRAKDVRMMQDAVTGEIVGFAPKPIVIWDGIERRNVANDRLDKLSRFYRRFNDVSPK